MLHDTTSQCLKRSRSQRHETLLEEDEEELAIEVQEMMNLPEGNSNFRKRGRGNWIDAVCGTMRTIGITVQRNSENLYKLADIVSN